MKIGVSLIAVILISSALATVEEKLAKHQTMMHEYIDLLSNKFVEDIIEKHEIQDAKRLLKQQQTGEGLSERKLNLKHVRTTSLNNVKVGKKKMTARERKLYEQLTNSYLMGSNSDLPTSNQLSILSNQQKSMQSFQSVNGWLNDLENNLDDMRDSINRRLSDMTVGLQRRNQLLQHYSEVGNLGI